MVSNSKDDHPSKTTPIMNTGVTTHPQVTMETNTHFLPSNFLFLSPIFFIKSIKRELGIPVGRQISSQNGQWHMQLIEFSLIRSTLRFDLCFNFVLLKPIPESPILFYSSQYQKVLSNTI